MVVLSVNWRQCTSMIRHWIGKSLSVCTKDILEGNINEEEVLLICTSTRHPFDDPSHFYDMRFFDSMEEASLLQRLWKQGRIHQPRMCSDTYNYGKEGPLFPYDNYRHKVWYSIKDQALTDLEDKPEEEYSEELEDAMIRILGGPDYNDTTVLLTPDNPDPEDVEFAKAVSKLSHGKLKLDYE